MSIQLRIFDSEDDGASIDLEQNRIYRAGNNIEYDIYLSDLSKDNSDCYFDFSIQGNEVTFLKQSEKIINIDFNNHVNTDVEENYVYEFPCIFEFLGMQFAFCSSTDSVEYLRELINSSSNLSIQNNQESIEMSESEISQLNELYPEGDHLLVKSKKYIYLKKVIEFLKHKNLYPYFLEKAYLKNKKIFLSAGITIGLMFFLLITFIVIENYSMNSLSGRQTLSSSNLQDLKQIEINLPSRFSNLKFMSNDTDMIVVMGVVQNKEDIIYLQQVFAKFKKFIVFKLITSTEAIDKLSAILKTLNVTNLTISFNNLSSRIVLTGLLPNLDVINDIELAVSNQIPQISDLDTTQVFAAATIDKDLSEIVASNSLDGRLTINTDNINRVITISGYLTQSEISNFTADMNLLRKKYQGLLAFNLNLKDSAASLPFKIVAVNTWGFPYFMTDKGEKVFEGSEIDGIRVDKITSQTISFSGKFTLIYRLDSGKSAN
jgi:hypothetical protein